MMLGGSTWMKVHSGRLQCLPELKSTPVPLQVTITPISFNEAHSKELYI